jgi:hypothetical protein
MGKKDRKAIKNSHSFYLYFHLHLIQKEDMFNENLNWQ